MGVAQSPTRLLGSTLSQLAESDLTVREVLGLAPQLICELGFERAIVSHVSGGLWVPEVVFIGSDPAWAAQIRRVGLEAPPALIRGLPETDIVRRRRAVLVTGVQRNPLVHRPLADATLSRSYVAAPIVSRGRVVGFLHCDRYGQARDVDEADRDLLFAFCEGLRMALSRAALAERLAQAQTSLTALAGTLETVDQREITMAGLGGELGGGLGGRLSGDASPMTQAMRFTAGGPGDLTRREAEVLALMAAGKTNQAIAAELFVAESTIKQHVKHILRKIGAANRAEAVAVWFREPRLQAKTWS